MSLTREQTDLLQRVPEHVRDAVFTLAYEKGHAHGDVLSELEDLVVLIESVLDISDSIESATPPFNMSDHADVLRWLDSMSLHSPVVRTIFMMQQKPEFDMTKEHATCLLAAHLVVQNFQLQQQLIGLIQEQLPAAVHMKGST